MTDKELLELAAKAVGITNLIFMGDGTSGLQPSQLDDNIEDFWIDPWNPLTDAGDALRLAVTLKIYIRHYQIYPTGEEVVNAGCVRNETLYGDTEPCGDDTLAATCRVIAKVAAAVGEDCK